MRVMKAGVLAVMLAGSASVAQAASCYRSDEIEADQAVRLQAQIMVLSDSCHSASYGDFRQHIGTALAAYQQKIIGHFRRDGASARGADNAFDSFITSLANKMALTYGREPVGSLCPARPISWPRPGTSAATISFITSANRQRPTAKPIRSAETKSPSPAARTVAACATTAEASKPAAQLEPEERQDRAHRDQQQAIGITPRPIEAPACA